QVLPEDDGLAEAEHLGHYVGTLPGSDERATHDPIEGHSQSLQTLCCLAHLKHAFRRQNPFFILELVLLTERCSDTMAQKVDVHRFLRSPATSYQKIPVRPDLFLAGLRLPRPIDWDWLARLESTQIGRSPFNLLIHFWEH